MGVVERMLICSMRPSAALPQKVRNITLKLVSSADEAHRRTTRRLTEWPTAFDDRTEWKL
jgi:hypothetical protein